MHKSDRFSLAIVYFEYSRTIDKVSHHMLLAKRSTSGIDLDLLSWISSILSNRTQIVKLKEVSSIPKPIASGAIQDSIFGRLLCTILGTNIFENVLHSKLYM